MRRTLLGSTAAAFAGIVTLFATAGYGALAQEQRRPLFADGECSGVLCSTIGGSQAPQNQPRKSLFPEGECGGILCGAIGGAQAPRHAEAPPPCGGGILCDMAPYAMGQPFVRPAVAPPPPAAAALPQPEPAPAKVAAHRRKTKAHGRQASAAN